MTSYNVTAEFAAGSAGTVTFRRKVWLNDNGALIPPADVVSTLAGSPPGFVQSLRATTETGVSPEGWHYEVYINLTGQEELVGSMLLTAHSELADVFQWEDLATPEFYATKGDLSSLTAAIGDPASSAELAAEEAAREAADLALEDALNDEEIARAAADTALDGRLDVVEPIVSGHTSSIGTHETRLDDLELLPELPTPVGESDGDILTIDTDAWVVAPPPTGGIGAVINSDGDPGDTIYIGITEPTDPPFDLEVGDVWIDTTPA